jgi:wobble nucleotide-excising tRNase
MGASAAGSVMDAFVAPPNSRTVVRGSKSEKNAAESSSQLETVLMDSVLVKSNPVDQAQNRRLTNLARRDKAMQQQLQAMSARISAINAKTNGSSRKKRK